VWSAAVPVVAGSLLHEAAGSRGRSAVLFRKPPSRYRRCGWPVLLGFGLRAPARRREAATVQPSASISSAAMAGVAPSPWGRLEAGRCLSLASVSRRAAHPWPRAGDRLWVSPGPGLMGHSAGCGFCTRCVGLSLILLKE